MCGFRNILEIRNTGSPSHWQSITNWYLYTQSRLTSKKVDVIARYWQMILYLFCIKEAAAGGYPLGSEENYNAAKYLPRCHVVFATSLFSSLLNLLYKPCVPLPFIQNNCKSICYLSVILHFFLWSQPASGMWKYVFIQCLYFIVPTEQALNFILSSLRKKWLSALAGIDPVGPNYCISCKKMIEFLQKHSIDYRTTFSLTAL